MSEPKSTPSRTAAALFQVLWDELVDLIGTPATAALLRRAIKRAAARADAVTLPTIRREGLGYAFVTPEPWQEASRRDAVDELRRLVREDLTPLCRELTGPVIARRLANIPELVAAGLVDKEEM